MLVSEDLTPIECERKLRALVTAMSQAQSELRSARDAEVDKKHEYEAAKRRAFLSADCPKPTRGGYTVADREVWVDDRCAEEQRAYDIATARREAARDHLQTVRDQSMIVLGLLRSVTTAYQLSGSSQHEGV
jgi:hypothetical protein